MQRFLVTLEIAGGLALVAAAALVSIPAGLAAFGVLAIAYANLASPRPKPEPDELEFVDVEPGDGEA